MLGDQVPETMRPRRAILHGGSYEKKLKGLGVFAKIEGFPIAEGPRWFVALLRPRPYYTGLPEIPFIIESVAN